MNTMIVYLDDAAYAQHLLAPMVNAEIPTRWVLVACAPRMSHRIGKWFSHSARETWRDKWCEKLLAQVTPTLQAPAELIDAGKACVVEHVVAKGPLPALTQTLRTRFGAAPVVDARRPKFGQTMHPVTHDQSSEKNSWQIPGAVGSLSALLMLASD